MELSAVKLGENNGTIHRKPYQDLDKTITKCLECMGRYQILLFTVFALNSLVYGINHTLASFHSYTPTFFCKDQPDKPNICNAINGSCPSGFEFDNNDDYTIVSQWSLVCERKYLATLVSTLYYVGVTFGALICGLFCDKFGRKAVLIVCLFSQGVLGILLRFASIFELFVVMRTFQGFFVQGIQGSCVTLLFEYTPSRLRTVAIIVWHVGFSIGSLTLAAISYAERDWKMLQLYISIPTVIFILYIWAIPESIFWLYASNRKQAALEQCLKTARYNGDTDMVKEIEINYSEELESKLVDEIVSEKEHIIIEKATLIDLVKSPPLRKHMLVMVFVNYIITIAFYGCMFFVNIMNGDHHMNYIITSSVDIVCFPIIYLLLRYYGTRFTIILYMYSAAFFCCLIGLVIKFVPEEYPHKVILVLCILVVCKTLSLSAFTTKVLYNAELFPTICRGAALGTCGFFARLGSVSAPFFMTLATLFSPMVPMEILAVVFFLSSSSIFLLPQTGQNAIPHSIADAEFMWGKRK